MGPPYGLKFGPPIRAGKEDKYTIAKTIIIVKCFALAQRGKD
jgi:hypothetical protein